MNSNGAELERGVHTKRTPYRSGWPRVWSTKSQFFRLSGFQSSHEVLIHVCYAPNTCSHYFKVCTEPIRDVTPHFGGLRDAASLRYRNSAVLMCEQKLYLVGISRRRKSYPI